MKLIKDKNKAMALGIVSLSLGSMVVHAGTMGVPVAASPFYFGAFGGAGGVNHESSSQLGTVFFPIGAGGPLVVNAFGDARTDTVRVGGAFLGYKLNAWAQTMPWALAPSVELEGYYFGATQTGTLIDPNSANINERSFRVAYPMDNGAILANGVLSFDNPAGWTSLRPYVGGGVGAAVVSITGANSTQIDPFEAGINHYITNTRDTDWTFAAQVKAGFNYSVTPQVGLFAEYRFLYLSPTDYTFGSTQYPSHVPTTNWNVHLSSMYYNMGTVGIRYDV